MKNNKNADLFQEKRKQINAGMRTKEDKTKQSNWLIQQVQRRQIQNIVKSKEKIVQIEKRRKNIFDTNQYRYLTDQNVAKFPCDMNSPKSKKRSTDINALSKNVSQKYFKRENDKQTQNFPKQSKKIHKIEIKQLQRSTSELKFMSPKKKNILESNEYKKLHDKLDSIQNKISDMKINLQKKRQQKQKIYEDQEKKIQKQFHLNLYESNNKKDDLKRFVTQAPEHQELHTFNYNPYSSRHNIVRAYMDQNSLAREHLITSLNIFKILEKSKRMSDDDLKKKKVNLVKKKGYEDKKTLIFDLDQTLIHCKDNLNQPFDAKLPIKFPTGEVIQAAINIRPYARQILKNLSKYFEIIIFTASHSCYANIVLDHLDPLKEWIHHRLYRQHCFLSAEGPYVKDLRIINRDLKDLILVDNAAYSYAYQLQNGVPILPYYHGAVDFELRMLEEYLKGMLFYGDIRQLNQKTFKLSQYKNYYNKAQELVQQLYLNSSNIQL